MIIMVHFISILMYFMTFLVIWHMLVLKLLISDQKNQARLRFTNRYRGGDRPPHSRYFSPKFFKMYQKISIFGEAIIFSSAPPPSHKKSWIHLKTNLWTKSGSLYIILSHFSRKSPKSHDTSWFKLRIHWNVLVQTGRCLSYPLLILKMLKHKV